MDTPGVELVKTALEPLCGCLHDIFNASVAESGKIRSSHQLTDSSYNSLGADLTRGLAHRELTRRGDVGGWQVAASTVSVDRFCWRRG